MTEILKYTIDTQDYIIKFRKNIFKMIKWYTLLLWIIIHRIT